MIIVINNNDSLFINMYWLTNPNNKICKKLYWIALTETVTEIPLLKSVVSLKFIKKQKYYIWLSLFIIHYLLKLLHSDIH